jgi:transcriptional antiterminator RfaH
MYSEQKATPQSEQFWYALYTRSRQERKVAESLQMMGYEVYLPEIKELRQWSDRTKEVSMPLFRSYCFVRTTRHRMNEAVRVKGAVRWVYWNGQPAVVRDVEIEEIKVWIEKLSGRRIEVVELEEQDRIKILSGTFAQQKAEVSRIDGEIVELLLGGLGMKLRVKIKELAFAKA